MMGEEGKKRKVLAVLTVCWPNPSLLHTHTRTHAHDSKASEGCEYKPQHDQSALEQDT